MIYLIIFHIIFILIANDLAQIPNNIRIVSIDKDFIRLSWTKPERLPFVYGYTIKYRPINSNQPWIVQQTNQTQILLNNLRPITKYEIIFLFQETTVKLKTFSDQPRASRLSSLAFIVPSGNGS